MPSSHPETMPTAIDIAWRLSPKSVLDVGVGYGKYGVLFREYLELKNRWDEGFVDPNHRNVRIDGVEGFSGYLGCLHKLIYDDVYVENILDFIKRDVSYDFIYFGDVLEHFEMSIGAKVMRRLVEMSKMGVLVSTPVSPDMGQVHENNPLETHRSVWKSGDFNGIAKHVQAGRKGSQLMIFLSDNSEAFNVVKLSRFRDRIRGLKHGFLDCWWG